MKAKSENNFNDNHLVANYFELLYMIIVDTVMYDEFDVAVFQCI